MPRWRSQLRAGLLRTQCQWPGCVPTQATCILSRQADTTQFEQRLAAAHNINQQRSQLAHRGHEIQQALQQLQSGAAMPAHVVNGTAPPAGSPRSDASARTQQPAAKTRRA